MIWPLHTLRWVRSALHPKVVTPILTVLISLHCCAHLSALTVMNFAFVRMSLQFLDTMWAEPHAIKILT